VYCKAQRLQQNARCALRAGQIRQAIEDARKAVYLVNEPETRATLAAALYQLRVTDSHGGDD